jgi:hypothetical protein
MQLHWVVSEVQQLVDVRHPEQQFFESTMSKMFSLEKINLDEI